MLLEFDRSPDVESDVIEVGANGEVLETWDVADIVRKAMIRGGDDPSAFVRQGDDWFHTTTPRRTGSRRTKSFCRDEKTL